MRLDLSERWQLNLIVCLFGSFTTVLAMTLMLPFLPLYVEQLGVTGHAAYTASKAALLMLTRAFALELAPHGIRVVGVAPGVTETGMNADLRSRPEDAERLRGVIPLGRFARPEEIAAAVAFVASDEASYLVGTVVLADGGWHVY